MSTANNFWYGDTNQATGDYSTCPGGNTNLASGDYSGVFGGQDNIASGDFSFVSGFNNSASGFLSMVLGGGNSHVTGDENYVLASGGSSISASGGSGFNIILGGQTNSIINTVSFSTILGGQTNTISGSGSFNCILGGDDDTISSSGFFNAIIGSTSSSITDGGTSTTTGAIILGGSSNVAKEFGVVVMGQGALGDIPEAFVQAVGNSLVTGDRQVYKYCSFDTTTNNILKQGSILLGTTIPDDSVIGFRVFVTARRTDANNECGIYELKGGIDRNSGTVALVGTVSKTIIAEDSAAWDVDLVANNTDKTLDIQITGEVGKNIAWLFAIELFRIKG